ncbi:hypothetical protein [Cysteiniphilum marinum]|uniref:hypothetical protein n=1 Tax=Cysteiniphilum marinum TaxID=2774191 RepID=UPI0019393766|nr:hypothetical protein [Cysteiniphilum marinum]
MKNQNNDNKKFDEILSETNKCKSPEEVKKKLEEYGFAFYDDGDDIEDQEELIAKPETQRQQRIVAYFESNIQPSEDILCDFLAEKYSDDCNMPLIRKYFKSGNINLKHLIMFGLDNNPKDMGLFSDFLFFSEFSFNLIDIINICTRSCIAIDNDDDFKEACYSFYCYSFDHDYDAYMALLENDHISNAKKEILRNLRDNPDDIFQFDFEDEDCDIISYSKH